MVRSVRLAATLVLILATGIATPLTFLWCEDGCDDIRVATEMSRRPACHHVSRAGQRFDVAPRTCGHDHATFVALRPPAPDHHSAISHASDVAIVVTALRGAVESRLVTRWPPLQPDTSPHSVASTILRI